MKNDILGRVLEFGDMSDKRVAATVNASTRSKILTNITIFDEIARGLLDVKVEVLTAYSKFKSGKISHSEFEQRYFRNLEYSNTLQDIEQEYELELWAQERDPEEIESTRKRLSESLYVDPV